MRKQVSLEIENKSVQRISSSIDLIGEYSWNSFLSTTNIDICPLLETNSDDSSASYS